MKKNDASIQLIALTPNTMTILAAYVISLDISFTTVRNMNVLAARTIVDTSLTTARLLFVLASALS